MCHLQKRISGKWRCMRRVYPILSIEIQKELEKDAKMDSDGN